MSLDSSQHARKMAVILHADVVDSTKLVQQNEVTAHERIQDAFRRLAGAIADYGGVAHEIRGDALVAEFKRASDSVCAALTFQAQNAVHNSELPDSIKPELRIGISLGEIVVADGTLTGPGVVLAQRLEQLAEPGQIVVQGTVSETVPARLPFEFRSLGEHTPKGFDQAVRAFAVEVTAGEAVPAPESDTEKEPAINTGAADTDRPPPADSGKPSIAVLPFVNMSGDPEQEYFSDGVTEDIITELSRFGDLFVIARNSSFKFKDQSVDIEEVGRQLGVQYVVEGSVRKSGQRARITAQLIDAATGNHVWADRYDRDLEDIFAVQDEVVRIITSTLVGRVAHAHRDRTQLKSTSNHDAYDWFIQGRELFYYGRAVENEKACRMFEKAIELDPDYAAAYALLGEAYMRDWATFWNVPLETSYERAWANANRALSLDDTDTRPHTTLGLNYFFDGEHEQAYFHLDKALALNPSDTRALVYAARVDALAGNPERAIRRMAEARRNNPFGKYDWHMVPPCYVAGRYEEAVRITESINDPAPTMLPWLAASYVQVGNLERAREVAGRFVEVAGEKLAAVDSLPTNWVEFVARRTRFKDDQDAQDFVTVLRTAGIPG